MSILNPPQADNNMIATRTVIPRCDLETYGTVLCSRRSWIDYLGRFVDTRLAWNCYLNQASL